MKYGVDNFRRKTIDLCETEGCINPDHFCWSDSPEYFWRRVDKSLGPDECWPWKGALDNGTGYGVIARKKGETGVAHRRALELTLGKKLPPDIFACHHCDNPPCCNPSHLFPGTRSDNSRDMVMKGRGVGENHGSAKTTAQKARMVKAILAVDGRLGKTQIARFLGLSRGIVDGIKHKNSWASVTPTEQDLIEAKKLVSSLSPVDRSRFACGARFSDSKLNEELAGVIKAMFSIDRDITPGRVARLIGEPVTRSIATNIKYRDGWKLAEMTPDAIAKAKELLAFHC
ncbi:MAG TPA: HNH endonuclease signature motif containing protein [Leptolyngbyaceae cyanobacterium]